MPGVLAAAADAGVALRELDAVVVGPGPGPFTGLRVGMATAAALGDALGIPVYGVARWTPSPRTRSATDRAGGRCVVTDARRREVYWAAYDGARPAAASVRWWPRRPPCAALLARAGCDRAVGVSAAVTGMAGGRAGRREPGRVWSRWPRPRCGPAPRPGRWSRCTCAGPMRPSPAPRSR